ncbi:MAG: pyruvate, phosphate dikinase [bacterium]|nr:pyruvate, phosphate dikinase [bacterium]
MEGEVHASGQADPGPSASRGGGGAAARLAGTVDVLGSKAETLERLRPLLRRSVVPDGLHFTVGAWRDGSAFWVAAIQVRFGGAPLAVRSSARVEDGVRASMAGSFRSCLGVDGSDAGAVRAAVEEVIASYGGSGEDQVLVQRMVADVVLSGVLMTHALDTGAPYYVINYDDESGRTDRVTGGVGVNKTLSVHHESLPGYIESERVAALVETAREVEDLCGRRLPLDIEFARTRDGRVFVLQVRRIAACASWDRFIAVRVSESLRRIERFVAERSAPRAAIAGSRTILGQMPDWNPAEILGTHPRPLATSLYRRLVTDRTWRAARVAMGYRAVPGECLMVSLAGRPYVDVRNSFNSFLPRGLERTVEDRLVDAWLDRLAANPELHDKVEFAVATTVRDFGFDAAVRERYPGVLRAGELVDYAARLTALTRRCVSLGPDGTLARATACIERLAYRQRAAGAGEPGPWRLTALLRECRRLGTHPFAVIARHAFVAEALLRSAVEREALAPERLAAFKASLETVTSRLTADFDAVLGGTLAPDVFLRRYGHLRPGTYDLASLRYDQRPDLFAAAGTRARELARPPFVLGPAEVAALDALLQEAGLDGVDARTLLRYARQAVTGREHAKFVFTRHLSDALEEIARWGAGLDLSREELSWLCVEEIADQVTSPSVSDRDEYLRELIALRRRSAEVGHAVRLGHLVRDAHDLYVVPAHRSQPNFVTARAVEAAVVRLDSRSLRSDGLARAVVCIENADPGFDWIFTRDIAGLVTRFGGTNSHMAIRCAEIGLPAAIGVGEQLFERVVAAGRVELDCGARVVRPLRG